MKKMCLHPLLPQQKKKVKANRWQCGYKIKVRGKYTTSILTLETPVMIEINMKGEWMTTYHAMTKKNFPPDALKSIKEAYLDKGYEANDFLLVEKPGLSFYLVDVSSDEADLQITLDANGKISEKKIR